MTKKAIPEPIIVVEGMNQEPRYVQLANGEIIYYSNRSPGKETLNEDALCIIPVDDTTLVLVVADGMGGMPAGDHASRTIIESLTHEITNRPESRTVRESILTGIDCADKLIRELKSGSGTTVSIVEISGNKMRAYQAGDSLIMLTSSHGTIKYLSTSHSPIGYALECGAIDQVTAMKHPERHLISNHVGSHDMYIQIGPVIELAPQDTLVLSSDALSDNLYEQEISEFIRTGVLLESAEEMIEVCQENMLQQKQDRLCHPDDFTLVCFRPLNLG